MDAICNDAISGYELLGRNLTETSNITKAGEIRDKAIYPRINRDDTERPGFFSNKISVVRLCRGLARGEIDLATHAAIAASFLTSSQNFRGFLTCRADYIKSLGLDLLPAASLKNPYHAHIEIPGFKEKFRSVEMISDVLPQTWIDILDELRNRMKVMIINPSPKYPPEWQKPSENPCRNCISM